jgi:hypothetical protein
VPSAASGSTAGGEKVSSEEVESLPETFEPLVAGVTFEPLEFGVVFWPVHPENKSKTINKTEPKTILFNSTPFQIRPI